MADIDKQELRKLAESQAQEPWFKQGQVRYHCKRTGEAHRIHHDDDAFIVAASPAAVLALLDEIEALRKSLAECAASLRSEMLADYHGQAPEDMHPLTRRSYDRDMAEAAEYEAAAKGGRADG